MQYGGGLAALRRHLPSEVVFNDRQHSFLWLPAAAVLSAQLALRTEKCCDIFAVVLLGASARGTFETSGLKKVWVKHSLFLLEQLFFQALCTASRLVWTAIALASFCSKMFIAHGRCD